MRRFFKTVAGKTILFIICILLISTLTVSVIGAVLLSIDDGRFYTSTEEELQNAYIGRRIQSDGYSLVWSAVFDSHTLAVDDEQYIYEVIDQNGKWIYRSKGAKEMTEWPYTLTYEAMNNDHMKWLEQYYPIDRPADNSGSKVYTLNIALAHSDPEMLFYTKLIHIAYTVRYSVYIIALASLFLAIPAFVALMSVSGRRPDTEELVPGHLNVVPYDIILSVMIGGATAAAYLCAYIGNHIRNIPLVFVCFAAICVVGMAFLLGLCMSTAARIKEHTLIKNTLIYRCLKLIWKIVKWFLSLFLKINRYNMTIIRGVPMVSKTVLIAGGITVIEFILVFLCDDMPSVVTILLIEKLIIIPALIYVALCLKKLQKGGKALADGDLSYVTDTKGMFWELKMHGEDLNSIAEGMAIAVEDRLKSERMKTTLITNVSHDIKTPLTSIINYAGLIGNEKSENKKITQYSEVLLRQSERLKRLIEDLVEASKASTGNLEVNLAPCDASVFLTQAAGEYEEKLRKSELTLVAKQPEQELKIMADGRRMWRIFDNLMNNICKYAQPGTRVYISLERVNDTAVINFKNTSREPLDMSEEELMERFTRGDASRNTEGSGLGLSIAKSMAELQGGDLRLFVDGDLFKAVLFFPIVK